MSHMLAYSLFPKIIVAILINLKYIVLSEYIVFS